MKKNVRPGEQLLFYSNSLQIIFNFTDSNVNPCTAINNSRFGINIHLSLVLQKIS